jgi:hypothetical protein
MTAPSIKPINDSANNGAGNGGRGRAYSGGEQTHIRRMQRAVNGSSYGYRERWRTDRTGRTDNGRQKKAVTESSVEYEARLKG